MAERGRWRRRLVAALAAALAIVSLGAGVGRRTERTAPERPPQVAAGRDRAALLRQGWSPAGPRRLVKPTYWPFVFALGIAFLLGGIATDFMLSGVGLFIFAVGFIGWIRDLIEEQAGGYE